MSGDGENRAGRIAGKRVVFVLAGEVLGGAERGAIDLAVALRAEEGASVAICALDDRPGGARRLADAYGISWTSIPTPWVGSRGGKLASLARVAGGLRRLGPDVLVSSTNLPNVVCGLTWRTTGASLAVWNQCDVNGTTRFSERLFRRALHRVPLVVTSAHHARDWLVETFGADPRRVFVIPGGVHLPPPRAGRGAWRTRYGLGEEDLATCMLAHFHAGKDHETVLRAWRIVVDRLVPARGRPVLLLAGRDAGNANAVKALAFDLDLREHVRFVGETDDVSGLLEASDLAVLCSPRECFPRGVAEPMAAGLAVAGTDVPGIREAAGAPGRELLVPSGDAEALAETIIRLASDPELRERIGRANADLVRSRQSPESTSRAFAGLLADGRRPRL
jgi:glycosyltransferase involved in cell wall biosynthesis